MKIKRVFARQILDSRGYPTVECDLEFKDGSIGRAAVPSGASTGTHEALELRDGDPKIYQGKSVLKAVSNVNTAIAQAISGKEFSSQKEFDDVLISLDGTENKSKLGANAILSVSLAYARAVAFSQKTNLFSYFQQIVGLTDPLLPVPMMNIINGGKHAAGSTDIQEFMVMPIGASSFSQALEMGANVFHSLGKVLHDKGYGTTVGDEGGYAPQVKNGNKEALDLIMIAVEKAGYKAGSDIVFALDPAASEFYEDGKYNLKTENKKLTTDEMVSRYAELIKNYPIKSIEDGLAESDWTGFTKLTQTIGSSTQIVGDDLFVTNIKFLEKGIKENAANAILIKLNQIGTVSETIAAVEMAKKNNWNAVISHRSGETEDTTIAHLVVGLATGQIKTGSLSRTDRVCKYNELLRIEESLGTKAVFAGRDIFKAASSR